MHTSLWVLALSFGNKCTATQDNKPEDSSAYSNHAWRRVTAEQNIDSAMICCSAYAPLSIQDPGVKRL